MASTWTWRSGSWVSWSGEILHLKRFGGYASGLVMIDGCCSIFTFHSYPNRCTLHYYDQCFFLSWQINSVWLLMCYWSDNRIYLFLSIMLVLSLGSKRPERLTVKLLLTAASLLIYFGEIQTKCIYSVILKEFAPFNATLKLMMIVSWSIDSLVRRIFNHRQSNRFWLTIMNVW